MTPTEDIPPADAPEPTRYEENATAEKDPAANAKADREVAAITRTVQPHSDAPSRSGITGGGTGADSERG